MTSYQKLLSALQKTHYAPIEYRILCTGETIKVEPVCEDMGRPDCEQDVAWVMVTGSRYPWLDSPTLAELGGKLDTYRELIEKQRTSAVRLAYDTARHGKSLEFYSDAFKDIFGRRPTKTSADYVLQSLAELESKAGLK